MLLPGARSLLLFLAVPRWTMSLALSETLGRMKYARRYGRQIIHSCVSSYTQYFGWNQETGIDMDQITSINLEPMGYASLVPNF